MKTYSNFNDIVTFTRTSGGTALRPISYGTELVTNGTFDTGDTTGWITQSAPSVFTVSSGQLTISRSATGPGYVAQTIPTTAGSAYLLSFDLIDDGPIQLRVGTSIAGLQIIDSGFKSVAGSYELSFVATGPTAWISAVNTAYSTEATIDNISVREVFYDQGGAPLTLFNHPANTPRIEYNAAGERLGLLVEEARTNLITYSEDFSNAAWVKQDAAVTANAVTAPDGTMTADKIVFDGTAGAQVRQSVGGLTIGASYNLSMWIKADSPTSVDLGFSSYEPQTITTDWQLFTVTQTADQTGHLPQIAENGETVPIYVWGAQVEAGDFPTSYIPTSGATATRAADVCSLPVSAFGYAGAAGTFYIEFLLTNPGERRALSVSTTAVSGTRVLDIYTPNETQVNIYSVHTGSTFSALTPYAEGGFNKIAATMGENDAAACANGGTVQIDTTTTAPADAVYFNIGRYSNAYANGHIKSIQYIPRRLTNAQLQELTS